MTRRPIFAALLLGGLVLSGTPSAAFEATPVALGNDGTSYRLWSGTFAELFGENPALPPGTPVLALDVVAPGRSFERHVVPETTGSETESSPVLLFDASADAVHLVWNSRSAGDSPDSRITLRSFSAAGWSGRTEISGGTVSDKSSLRAAIALDSYVTRVDDAEVRVPRRVLHLVWSEQLADGPRSYYTPVSFVAGRYLGWNPIVALDELANDEQPATVAAPADLRSSPVLSLGDSGRLSATFVHSASKRLVSVEIRGLPGELGELAEMARGHIVELIQSGITDRAALAEMARGHIVELAGRFHPATAAFLGADTATLLRETPAEVDGSTLAEMARGHIVELGREILDAGLESGCAGEGLVLEAQPLFVAPGATFPHYFAMRRVASWELPADVAPGQRLLTSADGSRALLGAEVEGQIRYRETVPGGGWSDVRSITLGAVPSAEAWAALARRVSAF